MFLVLIVRVVGRRPGRQLTPFEYVLVFFIGGLALTAIVGDERSFTSAGCQILAIALAHYTIAWARTKSKAIARLLDGTPLVLLETRDGQRGWRADTMTKMRVQDTDVMFSARDHGLKTLQDIGTVVLERNGDISILTPAERGPSDQQGPSDEETSSGHHARAREADAA